MKALFFSLLFSATLYASGGGFITGQSTSVFHSGNSFALSPYYGDNPNFLYQTAPVKSSRGGSALVGAPIAQLVVPSGHQEDYPSLFRGNIPGICFADIDNSCTTGFMWAPAGLLGVDGNSVGVLKDGRLVMFFRTNRDGASPYVPGSDTNEIVISADLFRSDSGWKVPMGSINAPWGAVYAGPYYAYGDTGKWQYGTQSTGVNFSDSNGAQFWVNNAEAMRIDGNGVLTNKVSANESIGESSTAWGSNCPAEDCTEPYTWLKIKTHDGSTGYLPIFK